MVETGMRVPRIHDLEALVNLLSGEYPDSALCQNTVGNGG